LGQSLFWLASRSVPFLRRINFSAPPVASRTRRVHHLPAD
jgi:hypothetical protein